MTEKKKKKLNRKLGKKNLHKGEKYKLHKKLNNIYYYNIIQYNGNNNAIKQRRTLRARINGI